MAKIQPFAAMRFTGKGGEIASLTCPPYDIISEEQRQAFLAQNPHNIIRLELPKGDDPYAEAGKTLNAWRAEEILANDAEPAIYIYEEEFTVRGERKKMRGFICRVHLEEFSKGIVLPHEETLSKAKQDRFHLMQNTFCNFSQVYSLYMDTEKISAPLLQQMADRAPDQEMTDGDGIVHRLWIVKDSPEVQALCVAFADRKLYIADGHHRYETAINFRNWCREQGLAKEGDDVDSIMMMLVDMAEPGLVVLPTHRLVRDLDSFDAAAIREECRKYFDVTEMDDPAQMEKTLTALYDAGKNAFGFYAGGNTWTQLVLRGNAVPEEFLPGASEALRGLDVSILHSLVVQV